MFVDDEDVANSPKQQFGEYTAGDIKYKDINRDGIIDEQDIVPIGYPTTPEIIYGFGFLLDIKRLILTASSRDRHGPPSLLTLCVSLRLPNLMIRTTNWEGNRLTMLYFRLLQIIIGASPTRICMLLATVIGYGYQ